MRLAAPFFAEKIAAVHGNEEFSAVFCSSFVDVATLRSLVPSHIGQLPFYTYFHENQFVYPVRKEDERDFHFGLTNLTTALSSDRIAFNTMYNLQTFIAGVKQILKICPDMKLGNAIERIMEKSTILYPGVDFSEIDRTAERNDSQVKVPVIIWNHRWEHDKNPKLFFRTLFNLDALDIDFRLILLGQSFKKYPAIFSEAQEKLQHKILHSGYVDSRKEYARFLKMGDIVVSTSRHEFYGIAVIEAVRAGCYPLLPQRLSYPELFPAAYLYEENRFAEKLATLLQSAPRLAKSNAKKLTQHFSWDVMKAKYEKFLQPEPARQN